MQKLHHSSFCLRTCSLLAPQGMADFGPEHADTFRRDLHPDLRADYVLANPPFNPAMRGTNFAYVQHFIHHLAPHGMAGFVLVRFWFLVNSRSEGCWFAV